MKCPSCKGTAFKAIANPDCKCPNGDGGFSYIIGELAELPCWHNHHGECVNCGHDVGVWNDFVKSEFIRKELESDE